MTILYEVVIDGENNMFQDCMEADNKRHLAELLKEKYPEDIGADAIGYDENGKEFGIGW